MYTPRRYWLESRPTELTLLVFEIPTKCLILARRDRGESEVVFYLFSFFVFFTMEDGGVDLFSNSWKSFVSYSLVFRLQNKPRIS